MAISEAAQRNHDATIPNHLLTLKISDPELVELFDSWASDDRMRDAPLDPRTRLMVQLAAIIVYQAVPYGGMAKVFDFHYATNAVLASRGIELPRRDQSTTSPDDRGVLINTVTQLLPFTGCPRSLNAIKVINDGTSS
jgi:4-carboxymuconolactone decarboxylase